MKWLYCAMLLFVHTLYAIPESFPKDSIANLKQAQWDKHVGSNPGIWISVARQKLFLIKKDKILLDVLCSTASKGVGFRANSNQTPTGWHIIAERIGDNLPWGAIFEERKYTGRIWSNKDSSSDDLILSRILRLQGIEQGLNKGIGIDSYDRFIYIHGTAEEKKLGTAVSHGCIRLSNSDVIQLFNLAPLATPVLITEW